MGNKACCCKQSGDAQTSNVSIVTVHAWDETVKDYPRAPGQAEDPPGTAEDSPQQEVIDRMRKKFDELDKDSSGTIGINEACEMVSSMAGQQATAADINNLAGGLIAGLDEDHSGTISFDEFCSLFGHKFEMDHDRKACVEEKNSKGSVVIDHEPYDHGAAEAWRAIKAAAYSAQIESRKDPKLVTRRIEQVKLEEKNQKKATTFLQESLTQELMAA